MDAPRILSRLKTLLETGRRSSPIDTRWNGLKIFAPQYAPNWRLIPEITLEYPAIASGMSATVKSALQRVSYSDTLFCTPTSYLVSSRQ